jgi:pyruvate formate lyase activating enzyme
MQEAILWHKERNGLRCDVCARKCFISKEKLGYCLVRKNENNKLFVSNFGKITNINTEIVEKKHLFHFFPNTTTLSISSFGDNFTHQAEVFKEPASKEYSPEQIVKIAEDKSCISITYSSIEPFMFLEFAYRTAKLAHRSNIKNVFMTNGYTTEDAVKKIAKYLDAIVVNFKASGDEEFYSKFMNVPDTKPIYEALIQMKKQRLHIEVADTIIPQIGDNIELCRKLTEWINTEIGSEVPFHVLQFHPDSMFTELPLTPVVVLEKCADEARKAGLRYSYIGNLPKYTEQNTYCYNCREPLIIREGYKVKKVNLSKDRCPNCGLRMNIKVE